MSQPTNVNKNVLNISNEVLVTNTNLTPVQYSVVISQVTNPLAAITLNSLTCTSFYQGSQVDSFTAAPIPFTPIKQSLGLTISASPLQNGATSSLIFTYITTYDMPPYAGVAIQLPFANDCYKTLTSTGAMPRQKMLLNGINGLTFSVTYVLNSVNYNIGTLTPYLRTNTATYSLLQGTGSVIELYFTNNQKLPKTGTLTITMGPTINPPNTFPLSGFQLVTGQTFQDTTNNNQNTLYEIEEVTSPYAILTTTTPGSIDPLQCYVLMNPPSGVGVSNLNYSFKIVTVNDIPPTGYFTLTFPQTIGISSSAKFLCQTCSSTSASLSYSANTGIIQINNAFSTYLPGGSSIIFDITGFTNPMTSQKQFIDFNSYATLQTGNYIIDSLPQSLNIAATQGYCTVNLIQPTDNWQIYGMPTNYTVQMQTVTAINPTDGIRISFPPEFKVINNGRCTIGLQSSRYVCNAYNTTNSIEIYQFTQIGIQTGIQFKFTVDSIINPGTNNPISGPFNISTITFDNKTVDSCQYNFTNNAFTTTNITDFYIIPQDTGVGQFPARYHFDVKPNGDIWPGSTVLITMPPEISIYSQFAFERSCGGNLTDFTYSPISCKTNGNQIWVNNGFTVLGTNNVTQTQAGRPKNTPYLRFDLTGFLNPRSLQASKPWNITILDQFSRPYMVWQYPYGPNVTMLGAASPRSFIYARNSQQNGAITQYNFTVITMNYLQDADTLKISLPYPVFATQESQCFGNSKNVMQQLPCNVTTDLSTIWITLKLPFRQRQLQQESEYLSQDYEYSEELFDEQEGRSLQGASTKRINSGESFGIRISTIKNPWSFKPTTDNIQYTVYTNQGFMIEQTNFSDRLRVNNTVMGQLNFMATNVVPSDFRQNVLANYTVTLAPVNYEQNMIIVITLPAQVKLSNTTLKCTGLAGCDYPSLNCTVDKQFNTITIKDAVTFQRGNPGTIKIMLQQLLNPIQNIITDSFKVNTITSENFPLDVITANMTVNFYCVYPCQSCNQGDKTHCNSCYPTSDYFVFFNAQCLQNCPDGWVNTTSKNCTVCEFPCSTCKGTSKNCTSCVPGYWKTSKGNVCNLKVYYPFPFFFVAFVMFICILISEIVTKQESRFKEAFIALISLPEIMAWCLYTISLFITVGYKTVTYHNSLYSPGADKNRISTMLAVLAIFTYSLINFSHAIIHPRKMVPNTLASYKTLISDHKCATGFHWTISYIVSFKYSLILVSYLWNQPQYKGDYSAMNWIQFNRISFSFLFIPYPLMMGSCAYYLAYQGLWSYTGFIACEVILISTLLAVLLLLDALSSVKCKTIGKAKSNRSSKVASGADYESDEDERPSRRAMKNQKNVMKRSGVQGANDSDGYDERSDGSEISFGGKYKKQNQADRLHMATLSDNSRSIAQTAYMDEETRRQIAMLEELAQQMREEKEQIRQEKQRIERERDRMQQDRDQQEAYLEQYMHDYSKQTQNLSTQVRELELQKRSLVTQVEQRLGESRSANNLLIKKLNEVQKQKQTPAPIRKKSFRNFESEMEDYEPVQEEEEKEEDDNEEEEKEVEEEEDLADCAQLPVKPAFGEIDYYRQIEGEDMQWMQQLTPRQGGDSMLGQHDVEDDGMEYVQHPQAEYDMVSAPPTREGEMQRQFIASQGSFDQMESQMNISQHDSEIFHARSDAAMEIESQVDSKEDTEQDFFEKESPLYSVLGDKLECSISQEFLVPLKAHFGQVPDSKSIHAVEQEFFNNESAMDGNDSQVFEKDGDSQNFMLNEDAMYQDLLQDGRMSRQATQQEFFKNIEPKDGRTNSQRSLKGSEQNYFEQEKPIYSQNGASDVKERERKQEFFKLKTPHLQQQASDYNDLSKLGDPEEYIDRQSAFVGKDESPREFREESHFAFQKDHAFFEKDDNLRNKAATGQDFFKHEEAIRGEVISCDQTVNAEPEQFFNNVELPEFGKPDGFLRQKSEPRQQEFIDKSPLSGLEKLGVQGRATPNATREDDPLDYFDKSEAEYGRQSTRQQRTATAQKFFDAEKAYAGRPDDYRRNQEFEQEYNPPASEDITGKSVSDESMVANHAPFNALTDFVNQNARDTREKTVPVFTPKPQFKDDVFKPMPQYKEQHDARKKKKTIIYSDKSESSVDEMMADTPSNYNIPNGRLDGKSMGLKAIMQQVKKMGQTGLLQQIQENPREHSPMAITADRQFIRGSNFDANMHQQQRQFVNNLTGLERSVDGGWSAMNQPGNARAQLIAEESSNQEHTSGVASQARRNRGPKTNKNFLESNLPQNPQQLNQQQQQNAQRQLQHMKNNFI